MEETKSLSLENSHSWGSESRFNQEWAQSFKDSLQLENRLKILEIEKQRKIKDIEKKLELHKRNVELKIIKYNHQKSILDMHERDRLNVTSYFNRFQSEKKHREENIKNLKSEVVKEKNEQFWNGKRNHHQALKKIKEMKALDREEKIQQRNKVRMMEIESKENIVNSWNRRIGEMKQSRQNLIDKKQKERDDNMSMMAKMGKKERKILKDIYQAEDMERDLGIMMEGENQMDGEELSVLYTNMN